MVEPQDSKEDEKRAKKKSQQAWITADGFRVTGLHSSIASDYHLRLLPTGTITELHEVHRGQQRLRWGVHRDHSPNQLFPNLGVEGKRTVC